MVVICDKPFNTNKYNSHFDKFPFPLSDFQKYSIMATIEGHHSLVTAHTGSGKSLPAEFAIEHFVSNRKRVIYTSPIKALSNQKYYDFRTKYPNITFGLMTGDIKMNPDADVLIMTTEILMNYLFTYNDKEDERGIHFQMDIKNELACVVFDEIHYINDVDRGNVWEQCILMLPEHVQMIMLSATIDSPESFAKWCERSNSTKKVYLSSTTHRIVPLKHYSYMITNESAFKIIKDKEQQKQIRCNTDKLMLIKDEQGNFNSDIVNNLKHTKMLLNKNKVFVKQQHVLNKISKHLYDKDMLPAIVFVFSRKNVEKYAKQITTKVLETNSNIPNIMARECEQIIRRLPNYKEILHLPEYISTVSLLEKGIGIHHSGMLPILREIIEIMISKKYINLLFATESFAIGLNCPIRSAVFTSLTKYDGNSMRYLHPHEYNQAASRCGRRGIDTIGHVIHCNNMFELPNESEYQGILCGNPQSLISKFRISFKMILNMMQNEMNTEDAFYEFVKKSMLNNEINKAIEQEHIYLKKCETDYKEKETTCNKTSFPLCERVVSLQSSLEMAINKKRKKIDKEIKELYANNPNLTHDLQQYTSLNDSYNTFKQQNDHCTYLDKYIITNLRNIVNILIDNKCLEFDNESSQYKFLNRGIVASHISETHPLILADAIEHTNYFNEFSVQEIITILSCFTDIKVSDDYKVHSFPINDFLMGSCINIINKSIETYADLEKNNDVYSGYNYDNLISYDIANVILKWCNCLSEKECKYVIETELVVREISIGEFTKAVMKISAMSNELIKMCETIGNIDLLHKLSQVDSIILKFITTNQSLYI
jgi:superfamily II RNA helicase